MSTMKFINTRKDDYTNITKINKDVATRSLNIFTPYNVSMNILRWMIGTFFSLEKRGIITYCIANRKTLNRPHWIIYSTGIIGMAGLTTDPYL